MMLWQEASLAFFAYVAGVGVWQALSSRPDTSARTPRLIRVLAGVTAGAGLVVLSRLPGQSWILTDWIWPPLVLLTSYWTSGLLFRAPVPRQEQALAALDVRFAVRRFARRMPRAMVEGLEAAYTAVYVLVPVSLLLHQFYGESADARGFWAVILITDFICFSALPWIQTRPPRSVEGADPWLSSVRMWNLSLLRSTSIEVNTCPSGHAAEALAAALLALVAPGPIVALMFLAAAAVSAGAVLGRYHYLADVLSGWVVAGVVFWLVV
jgi:membrane-associated phospholipid phosphatase